MKIAIMQPYFMPYIGYFQLISSVDAFVIYDMIKYTKKGWINRNRFLLNHSDSYFSLPLKKGSDNLNVVERHLSADFDPSKLLNQFRGAYNKAPYFAETFPLLERVVLHQENNLFHYIHHSLVEICSHLDIKTKILISSEVNFNNELKGQEKVIAICKALNADNYINPIGGVDLYSKKYFRENGVSISFLKPDLCEYYQYGGEFIPWLSILDVLMFSPIEMVRVQTFNNYELV